MMTGARMPAPKFLVVSFDGLRPDLIGPELTPNIVRLQASGVTLSRHCTVYPSETRVAFPSLVTGATSNRHGMVGNKYIDRHSTPPPFVDTADAVLIDRLNRQSHGGLMTAATLGEVLGPAGQTMAVLATNTSGTTRLFSHQAEDLGHLRFSGHFREACTPYDLLAEAEAQLGPLPPALDKSIPDEAGQVWITSAFLNFVWPRLQPDLTILSYGEPDVTSHLHGTGSEATRGIIRFCDEQFGRVLDWWEAEGRATGVQIIVASDHGHITAHSRISVVDALRATGFSPGPAPGDGIDLIVVPGQVGALYLADRSPTNVGRLVSALTEQGWCGPIFTAPRTETEGIALGSFASSLVFAEHERAPDVYFCFRADDSLDQFGLVGGTWYDSGRIGGLGVHGGLHPKELAAAGVMAGSLFRAGEISAIPSGICDFAPTMLHLLGLPIPATMTGRILHEALSANSQSPPFIETESYATGLNDFRQTLIRVRVGQTTYLQSATAMTG